MCHAPVLPPPRSRSRDATDVFPMPQRNFSNRSKSPCRGTRCIPPLRVRSAGQGRSWSARRLVIGRGRGAMPPAVGRLSGDGNQHAESCCLCCLPWQRLVKSTTSRRDQDMTATATISKHAVHRRRLKVQAVEMLGGKCQRCGFSDQRALCLRHDTPLRRGRAGLTKRDKSSTASHRSVVSGDSVGLSLMCWNCSAIVSAQDPRSTPTSSTPQRASRRSDGASRRPFCRFDACRRLGGSGMGGR